LQPAPQRPAVGELHREVDIVALGPDLVHLHDVGVIHARHGLRLAQQAGSQVGGCSLVGVQ
jgi:hypothetical protein